MDTQKSINMFIKGAIVLGCIISLTIEAMVVKGFATYSNKTINEPIEATKGITGIKLTAPSIKAGGPTTLKNSSIGDATIKGSLTSDKTTFSGPVTVEGNVIDRGSTFESTLDVTVGSGGSISLRDTKTKNIVVHLKQHEGIAMIKKDVELEKQVKKAKLTANVTLQGKTEVDGSITFTGGEGNVTTAPTAKITGTIVHEPMAE